MNNGSEKTIIITTKIGLRTYIDLVDLINTIHADEDGWFDRLTRIVEEAYPDQKDKVDSQEPGTE